MQTHQHCPCIKELGESTVCTDNCISRMITIDPNNLKGMVGEGGPYQNGRESAMPVKAAVRGSLADKANKSLLLFYRVPELGPIRCTAA